MKLETVVDSRAAESVAPLCPTGTLIVERRQPNTGRNKFDMVTLEGHGVQAAFQVAEVTRPLCSVSKMCDKRIQVVFELGEGNVEHIKKGTRPNFTKQN